MNPRARRRTGVSSADQDRFCYWITGVDATDHRPLQSKDATLLYNHNRSEVVTTFAAVVLSSSEVVVRGDSRQRSFVQCGSNSPEKFRFHCLAEMFVIPVEEQICSEAKYISEESYSSSFDDAVNASVRSLNSSSFVYNNVDIRSFDLPFWSPGRPSKLDPTPFDRLTLSVSLAP
ncbi:hypothetical protein HPP92_025210 [Vanilla planifolia]|uniref:Uncharacterized protein n=1 Tax=Vanilla planifolia TaxID=51239 RepID=A0A835PHG4_VANPL|nr:hypothetical protein HPP92_025210 [Vanilla planifolia]